jgi:predicted Zn-dependent protease
MIRWGIIALLGLTGCTSFGPVPGAPSPTTGSPEAGNVTGVSRNAEESQDAGSASANAATLMLTEAKNQRAAGALPAAESTIERALRIEPNDPWLWIELGEIKLQSGDLQQAQATARKALTLGGGDPEIERRANRLLRTR